MKNPLNESSESNEIINNHNYVRIKAQTNLGSQIPQIRSHQIRNNRHSFLHKSQKNILTQTNSGSIK